ncbi:hypothetical protein [Oikeobacillus pervagus]|nr:hypothetical protein [Oikeobacillus pervagus]
MYRELASLARQVSGKLQNEVNALSVYQLRSQGLLEEANHYWEISAKNRVNGAFLQLQSKTRENIINLVELSDFLKHLSELAEQLALQEERRQK